MGPSSCPSLAGGLRGGLGRGGLIIFDPRHEARCVALDQGGDLGCHRIQQLLQPDLVGLGEVVQHVAVHQLLLAGMADAQAHPPELLADVGLEGADAVVAAGAAALLDADLAGREVDLVVDHDDLLRRQLEEAQRLADRPAGFVHIGLRLYGQHLFPAQAALGAVRLEAVAPRRKGMAADDLVHRHEADVVPIVGVAGARIAEPGKQQHAGHPLGWLSPLWTLPRQPLPLRPRLRLRPRPRLPVPPRPRRAPRSERRWSRW